MAEFSLEVRVTVSIAGYGKTREEMREIYKGASEVVGVRGSQASFVKAGSAVCWDQMSATPITKRDLPKLLQEISDWQEGSPARKR